MSVDVLYVAWNRREFTEKTFANLLEQTDWSLVRELHVHDDASDDGTLEYLRDAVEAAPVRVVFQSSALRSPPAVMNRYVGRIAPAEWFAKIDNDIMVPPGWLSALLGVVTWNPELDLLGMEAGRTGTPHQHFGEAAAARKEWQYEYEKARHIGGVGLFRTQVFASRPRMRENAGRDGLTHFQREYAHDLEVGWIVPDLLVCSLDQVPADPWRTLAAEYVEKSWSRPWEPYHERYPYYHAWWSGIEPNLEVEG